MGWALAVAMLSLSPSPTLEFDRNDTRSKRPIVIAHRGASGYRPEHTLEAYDLGIEQGADFVEPDLVITKDGVLICRHENEISGTTNVAEVQKFADRKTTKVIDGQSTSGWFTEDFTLAELKELRCRERLPQLRKANVAFNDQFQIPTLQEVIELVRKRSKQLGRTIGIYPETKHPSYFRSIGLSLETRLVQKLNAFGWVNEQAPVFIQSFETQNLRQLKSLTQVRLVQLIDSEHGPFDSELAAQRTGSPKLLYSEMIGEVGLKAIRSYAHGIGVAKSLIVPRDQQRHRLPATDLIAQAHKHGLVVHAWTFRNEAMFLPVDQTGDPTSELKQFFDLGIDGVFADFPDTAIAARSATADRALTIQ